MRGDNIRVVLVHVTVVAVVELLGVLLGVVLGLLSVDVVETLGLDELVGLGTGKGSEGLLGEAVLDGLALLALLVLEEVHGLEGGSTADKLVGELALVLLAVHGLVVVLALVCVGVSRCPSSLTTSPPKLLGCEGGGPGAEHTESEHVGGFCRVKFFVCVVEECG